jgi:hypothetical protein
VARAQSVGSTHVGIRQRVGALQLGPAIVAPRGVYCSCPPTTASSDSVMTSVAQLPFVEGILVRVPWNVVEPARGAYDFSLVTRQLDRAGRNGKRVALAIVQGAGTPAWLAAEGAQTISWTDFSGNPRTAAVAWDATYLAIWSDTVTALGAAFDGDARIALVHACNASSNGFEMQLPIEAQAAFVAAGYTEQAYVDSWEHVVDVYAAAFPSHALDVEVHPVFGSDTVALAVTAHGLGTVGARYGAFGAWWSVDNALQAYPGMFSVLTQTAPATFANAQVVGSWITTPQRFDNDLQEYMDGYDLALTSGLRYVEVWNADLLAPSLQPFLTQVNDALKQ